MALQNADPYSGLGLQMVENSQFPMKAKQISVYFSKNNQVKFQMKWIIS